MKIKDTLHETYIALSANRVRSGLTILGIVIGISSVIVLVSVGQGATGSIQSSIQSLGSNLIEVMPGSAGNQGYGVRSAGGTAKSLTVDDATAIKGVSGVADVAMEVSGRYQVTAKGTNTNTTVDGVSPSYASIRNLSIAEGSFITDSQVLSGSKVAVIGPTVRDDLFGEDAGSSAVGQAIRINNLEFKVVGITESKGGSGMSNQDDMIYIPYTSALRYLAGSKYLSVIDIQATDSGSMTQVTEDITSLLLARHNKTTDTADFRTLNQNDLLSAVSSVSQTLTLLLAAIASISLLVGGIGIMNMMLTTVTERTREIGLRKAIGAKEGDISKQFLTEAIVLTVLGGAIGVALGWGISFLVSLSGVLATKVTLSSVLLAFGVSAVIGIIFGWYPARRASALNPIDALRYE